MTEQHTPGPWKAHRGVEDDTTRWIVTQAIAGHPKYLIAEIHNGAPGDSLETEEANARLFAAAPDLLGALTAEDIDSIVGAIDDFVIGPVEDEELRAIWQPSIDKLMALRAAIAKAEGQS